MRVVQGRILIPLLESIVMGLQDTGANSGFCFSWCKAAEIRHELFEPSREDAFIRALLELIPELTYSWRSVGVEIDDLLENDIDEQNSDWSSRAWGVYNWRTRGDGKPREDKDLARALTTESGKLGKYTKRATAYILNLVHMWGSLTLRNLQININPKINGAPFFALVTLCLQFKKLYFFPLTDYQSRSLSFQKYWLFNWSQREARELIMPRVWIANMFL